MAVEKKIGDAIKARPDYLAYQQTLPQNTSADGNGGAQELGKVQGALEVEVQVETAIVLADTENLNIKLQAAPDVDGVPGSYTDLIELVAILASGEYNAAVGDILGQEVVKPEADIWVKAVITTDDAAVTGAVSIYPKHIAR